MGVLRHRVVRSMQESDSYGRLYLYYPSVDGNDIFVHAKTLIIDNRLAFVGSTNLSNRSMGLDTECSVALDSALLEDAKQNGGSERKRILEGAIQDYLCSLLAEHLGQNEAAVKKSLQQDSLAGTIARFRGGKRSLVPLKTRPEPLLDAVIPQEQVDPEKPIQVEKVLADILPLEP